VAVAICDRGKLALSAVYCYYDVAFSRLSPGVFSILTQIQLCRDWHMRYVYLGYYVAGSPHMSYKAQYQPHERIVSGRWRAESGERRAESVERRAESVERRAESVERRAEGGERRA